MRRLRGFSQRTDPVCSGDADWVVRSVRVTRAPATAHGNPVLTRPLAGELLPGNVDGALKVRLCWI